MTSGDWRDVRGGRVVCRVGRVLWGGPKDLMREKSEKGYNIK